MGWKGLLLIIALLGLPLITAAQPAPIIVPPRVLVTNRAAQIDAIQAATTDAVRKLNDQIGSMDLIAGIRVRDYLRDMDAREDFVRALRAADQFGAPRWLDAHTCQIELRISSTVVSRHLQRIAAANPRRSRLTPVQIDLAIRRWPARNRFFNAVGTSAMPQAMIGLPPPAQDNHWRLVPPAICQQTLQNAREDAARRTMASVSAVRVDEKQKLGDAFAIREVGEAVHNWLVDRPVTRVEFKDDMHVEVVLGVNEEDFCTVVETALARQKIALPKEGQARRKFQADVITSVASPVGRAALPQEKMPAVGRAVKLPAQPPAWAEEQIIVQGESKPGPFALRNRNAAEASAREALKRRLEALPLEGDTTVEQAAKADPRIAAAMEQAVRFARVHKTEYRPDGTVVAHLFSDLRNFWIDLRQAVP